MPAHHNLEAYIDAYVAAATITEDSKGFLIRSAPGRKPELTTASLTLFRQRNIMT
jgi:integrase/recombinase XerD